MIQKVRSAVRVAFRRCAIQTAVENIPRPIRAQHAEGNTRMHPATKVFQTSFESLIAHWLGSNPAAVQQSAAVLAAFQQD